MTRKQIKGLGLSFRGRNAWPIFRRYEPGFSLWYINEEECTYLTHAIRQTLYVAEKVLAGQLKMDMEQGKTIVRYSRENDGKLEWNSKEIKLAVPTVSYNPVLITDDVLIQKLIKAGRATDESLQADTCYLPSAVQENKEERPYFPRAFILANKKSGLILDYDMYQSIGDDADVVLNKLINLCANSGIPKEILVQNDAMAAILDDFCKKVKIKLKIVKRLAAIDQMIEEMAYRF
jgi:hypothetical protein